MPSDLQAVPAFVAVGSQARLDAIRLLKRNSPQAMFPMSIACPSSSSS
jgi:hypothetical protein